MPNYIAFDTAHKPRGKIDENLTELRDYLNSNDLICYNFLETPITHESLTPYDILVFVCPDFSKITHQEMTEIENWVKLDGGGLLVLSHAGGDRGRNSNLSELSEQFGIAFESDQVLDEENNIGMENMPICNVSNTPPHPITEGISSICYRAGCSLSIVGNAFSVANSNETSEPFSCPLICVSEVEHGRVVALGSYEMFRDRIGGGFSHDQHSQLAHNIFNWLVSDYRMELRAGTSAILPESQEEHGSTQKSDSSMPLTSTQSFSSSSNPITMSSTIKIDSKSDLMNLLNSFLNQINSMKTVVEQLIKASSASGDELLEIKNLQALQSQPTFEIQTNSVSAKTNSASAQTKEKNYKELYELKQPPLSALPPKPSSMEKAPPSNTVIDDGFIGLAPVNGVSEPEPEDNSEQEPEDISEPQLDIVPEPEPAPPISKEELLAELDGLQSKLNSVFNLLSFIEKKHESGKLNDKAYKKQKSKLQKDVSKTQQRIAEIQKQVE